MSVNQEIIISKDEILNRYSNLNSTLLDVLNTLYGEENDLKFEAFSSNEIISTEGSVNVDILNNYKDSIGIYIFLDSAQTPVYIGVSGKGKQRLHGRLKKHFNCSKDSNLSSNIYHIENLLGNIIIPPHNDIERKNLILEYAPKLLVIEIDSYIMASAIEQSLIALFNSKYNK